MDISSFILGLKMGGGGGGGSSVTVESLSVTENGTTTAPTGKAYSPVVVNVPNSYSAGDEGKVVSNGALVAQSSDTVTQNGTVDTTLINSLLVNVSGGGASNIKTGTFTPKTENVGTVETLDTGYDGNGYPIAALIVVDGGPYNPANTDWYNLVQNKAVAMVSIAKQDMASAPEYVSDHAFVMTYYKSTAANSFTAGNSYSAAFFSQSNPYGTQSTAFLNMSDKRTLKYNVANANYGFKDGITYRYWIVYSE